MNDVERICRDVYEQTKLFEPISGYPASMGYEILMGPPHFRAPIAFIGYQPGLGPDCLPPEVARQQGYEDTWPDACEYATERWALARTMRTMFGRDLLLRSVGMNAIFVRSRNVAQYVQDVSKLHRHQIQEFCRDRVKELLDGIQPEKIVVIGFSTLDIFGGGAASTTNAHGRTLTKRGSVFGRDAIATLHLTGARISNADRSLISSEILGR